MSDAWDALRTQDAPEHGWVVDCLLGGRDPLRTNTPIDAALGGGLMPGVTVLGGQASVGKSALACNVAAGVAMRGGRVLYATLDDSWDNVWARCAAAWSCYATVRERHGIEPIRWSDVAAERAAIRREFGEVADPSRLAWQLTQRDGMARTMEIFAETDGKNIAVLDNPGTVPELEEAIRSLDEPPALFVVDYVQQFAMGDAQADQQEYTRVTQVAAALQRLALDLRMPILELSSLRKLGGRDDTPSLDWYRGASGIGYAAQAALVLTSDDAALVGSNYKPAKMHVVKNKSGRAGFDQPVRAYGASSLVLAGKE